jgi:hypothetical protein
MSDQDKNWLGYYHCSPSGLKASSLCEPKQSKQNTNYTEAETVKRFNQGLTRNVEIILNNIQKYSDNTLLKKRLQKYGNDKALAILIQIEQMIKDLPKI